MRSKRARRKEHRVRIRVHGGAESPTLVYLPGVHGDWTLVEPFRNALHNKVRFVELTYPRTLTWSLNDYADKVEEVLLNHDIREGWLLGESFGSQIVWPMLSRNRFRTQGVILAGGFARHPWQWGARLGARVVQQIPLRWQRQTMCGAIWLSRRLPLNSRDSKQYLVRFVARRTELDRDAMARRLLLVAENDPRIAASHSAVPVHLLSGLFDPIVFWWPVRRWFKTQCPSLGSHQIVRLSDHNVLCSAPKASSSYVLRCMGAR